MMNIEVRADGARITGYVNVTEKKSRPVITPRGKVIEEIEPRAFSEAISRAGNITVTVDHDKSHIYASTDDGTVTLKEDAIGLHADADLLRNFCGTARGRGHRTGDQSLFGGAYAVRPCSAHAGI